MSCSYLSPWLLSAIWPCLLLLLPFLPPNIPASASMSHICMHMCIYLNPDFTYERKWDSFLHSRPLSHAPNDWNSMNFITHVWPLYLPLMVFIGDQLWSALFGMVEEAWEALDSQSLPHTFSFGDLLWLHMYPPLPISHLNLPSRSPLGKRCLFPPKSYYASVPLHTAYLTQTHPQNFKPYFFEEASMRLDDPSFPQFLIHT